MSPAQKLFQRNKELRKWWKAIVEDPRFEELKLHTRSMALDSGLTNDQLNGAKLYEGILTSICEPDETGDLIPGPGLHHDLETSKNLKPSKK